ncbi:MAG: B12-binding domain-containing radical SAM protein [Pseudobdellovibrio sp.]
MLKKIRVSFINPPHADWCLPNMATWIFIKSYYNRYGLHKEQIEWINPPIKFNLYKDIPEIYQEIADCDVILFSSYIWNYDICDNIARYVRKQDPTKILILGGPHIGLNDLDFFKSRPKYDYICQPTKPGEIFFSSLIDQYYNFNKWPEPELIDWEIQSKHGQAVPLPDYSVYRENFDYYKSLREYARIYQLEPFIIIETTRGCPYSCVYCEWGGGTGSKIVQKPIEIVKKDILALKEAGFNAAYLTDANFGIFESRDIEIFRYAFEINFALTDISTMKSKNLEKRKQLVDAWFNIAGKNATRFREDKTVRTKATWGVETEFLTSAPTVSIQSISEEAMKVAQRVDLSFEDKITLSEHIRNRSQAEGFPVPPLELILAMPGSTLEDFYNELKIIWNFKTWSSFRHDYMFLPDTRIANADYIKKYKIELVQVYSDLIDEAGIDNQFTLYKDKRTYFKTVTSCYSYNRQEFYEMFFMNSASNYLLEHIYPMFEAQLEPPEFGKICYQIIKDRPGFNDFALEIQDIFDPLSPPRSIKKLKGKLRTDAIKEFLEIEKLFIINEIYIRIINGKGHQRNIEA